MSGPARSGKPGEMRGLFITGTGTDIGKTFVSCAILRQLVEEGVPVAPRKPVISGFDPEQWEASDTGRLIRAAGLDREALDRVSPFRFRDPLSPDMAARRAGRSLRLSHILQALQEREEPNAVHVVEGVGGVRVPVEDEAGEGHTVREWMAAQSLPIVLVTGSYLGTLSHTFTALDSLQAVGLHPAWLVVSDSPQPPVPVEETMQSLRKAVPGLPMDSMPRLPEEQVPNARLPLPPGLRTELGLSS